MSLAQTLAGPQAAHLAETPSDSRAAPVWTPEAAADRDAKRAFLRMVSHELRTPLNSIIGFSDILHQELYGPLGSPQYVEYAGIIRDSGNKLLCLFNNFLEIVRLESGSGLEVVPEPVLPLMEAAAQRVLHDAKARELNIDIRLHDEALCARVDARALASCFDHLLHNALDYAPAGSTIELDAWRHDDKIELSVFNRGNAPDPADIPRLMKPFEQGESAHNRSRGGAGLGWAIVALNCQAMGGSFGAVSHPGESLRAIMRFEA